MNQAVLDLQELYDTGKFAQAFRVGTELFGALGLWPDQVLAGRVAVEVGGQSLYPFVGAWLFGLSGRVEEAAKKLTEATEKLPRSRWDQQQKLVTQMILRALENASTVSPAFQDYREKLQQRWA